jgi:hypothetical protein
MKKLKITARRITEEEAVEGLSPKRAAALKKDLMDLRYASKHKIETFNGSYSSVPIPLHILKSKISKEDEHNIYQLVAMVVNKLKGRHARTVRFVSSLPKESEHRQRIIKQCKYSERRGQEDKVALDKLWKRKEKLKKHELFRIALGI